MSNVKVQIGKKDSTWISNNPTFILSDGQLLFDEDNLLLYIGDGVTELQNLTPILNVNGYLPLTLPTDKTVDLNGYVCSFTSTNTSSTFDIYLETTDGITRLRVRPSDVNLTAFDRYGVGLYQTIQPNAWQVADENDNQFLYLDKIANHFDINADTHSTAFIKNGGTSSEFLKADGSSDSNTYQTVNVIVSGNLTASNDTNYINAANATYTDPTPSSDKGFTVYVLNGTATVGGIGYSTVGTLIRRMYHSGSWVTKVSYDKAYYDTIYQTVLGYTAENASNKSSSYTASSTTTYPNSKALVDGLAIKPTILYKAGTTGTITGFTGEQIIYYVDLSDKCAAGHKLVVENIFRRISTSANSNIGVYINSSASLSGATVVANFLGGSTTNQITNKEFDIWIESSTSIRWMSSANNISNDFNNFASNNTATISLSSLFIIVAVTLNNSSNQVSIIDSTITYY